MPLFEEAVRHRKAKYSPDNLETLAAIGWLGAANLKAKRVAESIPLLEEAYEKGRHQPKLKWVGPFLLEAYRRADRRADATKMILGELKEAREKAPPDSASLSSVLAVHSLPLLNIQAYAEAEPLLRECLAIREKTEPDSWTTFNTKSMLGGSLLGQKKHKGAEPLLKEGYEGMKLREKTIPPEGKVRLREAVERLVQLYEAIENPVEAERCRKELAIRKATEK